jgi:hypothetical protein
MDAIVRQGDITFCAAHSSARRGLQPELVGLRQQAKEAWRKCLSLLSPAQGDYRIELVIGVSGYG